MEDRIFRDTQWKFSVKNQVDRHNLSISGSGEEENKVYLSFFSRRYNRMQETELMEFPIYTWQLWAA